ncbi:BTAD domain-containing putative transcriptional regulator [Devosia sp.]|uniref:BTAD domain-containing putative transcriptional regulator n=1 Tax=Devosia sp. TaxID=1871048 RepID=UPI002607DE2F|nr:BTAD domain-containing putative transcriptional regulator [Devosia sp.]
MTNLRQTLLHTRDLESRYGFELFQADATEIELNREVVVDLREITRVRTAEDAPELERLIALYRGELLAGVGGLGSEFDQWLALERTRIENQFANQATEAALRIGGSGAHAALFRLAERLPYSDVVCRATIELFRSENNESGARAAFAAFRNRLRHGLGLEPSAETADLFDSERPLPAQPRTVARRSLPEEEAQRVSFVPRVVLLPPLQDFKQANIPKHLAPALVEDVTIGLSRLKSVSVIAPHTAWQLDPFTALDEVRSHQIDYAVESRIAPHFASDGLSLAIRLVRAAGREIVWADKFAFNALKAPEHYWDFTNGVARALADSIETAELQRERTQRDANAYTHYLTGRHNLRSFDLPKIRRGRKSLRIARDIEPEQASIESALARSYVVEWVLRSGSDKGLLDKAKLHAERAVSIDPNDGTAYRELGRVALFDRDLDQSLQHMAMAAELAPNHADVLADFADTLVHNSDFAAAQEKIDAAVRLNPVPPDEYLWTLGGINFFRGRWEEALRHLNQMRNPEPALRLMAATAAMAGRMDLARRYRLQALKLQPDFTTARWVSRMPQRDPADVDLYIEALRKAGFK